MAKSKQTVADTWLASSWHPTFNKLAASEVSSGSNKKAWWLCENSHDWEVSPAQRMAYKTGCPVCSNKKVLAGYNDLATINPELAAQWHPTKNLPLSPEKIGAKSNRKVWWFGLCGHEWPMSVVNRHSSGQGCPVCAGKTVLAGFNDLASLHPNIARQWSAKNSIGAHEVTARSGKKFLWEDELGHEWPARVADRTAAQNPTGCPVCSGKLIIAGINDFATLQPVAAKQWHPTKNGFLTPQQVAQFSNKKAWWLDDFGHEWPTVISQRAGENATGCPVCSGRTAGENSIANIHPDIAKRWIEAKNTLTPHDVAAGSHHKVWLLCFEQHPYRVEMREEVEALKARGIPACPYCHNDRVLVGYNDLASQEAEPAALWHPTKNGPLTPQQVVPGSAKKVWWLGNCGHEWPKKIYQMMNYPECPDCRESGSSQAERRLFDFLSEYVADLKPRVRLATMKRRELDMYSRSAAFAIEFNGLYWHTEKLSKDSTYHASKHKLATESGIILLQIWEDDWRARSETIKRVLLRKLELEPQQEALASSAKITELTQQQAQAFYEHNHIQGFAAAKRHFALVVESEVVLAVSLQEDLTSSNTWEIVRHAAAGKVEGGFGALMTYIEETLQPAALTATSDNCISDDAVYEHHGFKILDMIEPDYSYLLRGRRVNQSEYSIERFRTDPKLKFINGLNEHQLADLNGFNRIWDAGKVRWVKRFPK